MVFLNCQVCGKDGQAGVLNRALDQEPGCQILALCTISY